MQRLCQLIWKSWYSTHTVSMTFQFVQRCQLRIFAVSCCSCPSNKMYLTVGTFVWPTISAATVARPNTAFRRTLAVSSYTPCSDDTLHHLYPLVRSLSSPRHTYASIRAVTALAHHIDHMLAKNPAAPCQDLNHPDDCA